MKFHPAFAHTAGLNSADARASLPNPNPAGLEMNTVAGDTPAPPVEPAEPQAPSAIPIYDAARDSGTLVVNNLPAAEEGRVYNLWVTTAQSDKPVYVGSLPASRTPGADSFDFSLGSNMVIPSGFMLTKDPENQPAAPGESNTVLKGPPAASNR